MSTHKVNAELNNCIEVSENDIIEVKLEESPTTGYMWEITNINPEEIQLINNNYQVHNDDVIGGGGNKNFKFKVIKKAKGNIKFENKQKWSNDVYKVFMVNYS